MRHSGLTQRLYFRIAEQDRLLIEQAAEVVGLKPNAYVRQKLIAAAEKDLQKQNLIFDEEAWKKLKEIMGNLPTEYKKLRKAASEYRKIAK